MTKRLMTIILVAAIMVSTFAIVNTASAEVPDEDELTILTALQTRLMEADDPHQEFALFSDQERQVLIDGDKKFGRSETHSEFTLEINPQGGEATQFYSTVNPKSETCVKHIGNVVYKVGILKYYTYETTTKWCWDGDQITQIKSFKDSYSVHAPLMEFVRTIDMEEEGGAGEWTHNDYARGHFRLCGLSLCLLNYYPQIEKFHRGDGWNLVVTQAN